MKNSFTPIRRASCLMTICLVAAVVQGAPPAAKRQPEAAPSATNDIPQSVFAVPASPEEGRDPFFPNASRETPAKQNTSTAANALILNGIGGTPDHKLAMINGHTMAEGETNEVTTASGHVRIRCLEIKGESAVIEVIGGERRELHLRN